MTSTLLLALALQSLPELLKTDHAPLNGDDEQKLSDIA